MPYAGRVLYRLVRQWPHGEGQRPLFPPKGSMPGDAERLRAARDLLEQRNSKIRDLMSKGYGTIVLKNPRGKHSLAVGILSKLNLDIYIGDTLGIVGETGSGKTMLGWSIINLLPKGCFFKNGDIKFNGKNIFGVIFSYSRYSFI